MISFVGLIVYSCSDCEPISDPGNILVVSFYSKDVYESSEELVLLDLNISSVSTLIEDADSIMSYDSLNEAQFGVPLPVDAESFTFYVNYPDTLEKSFEYYGDTITTATEINRSTDTIAISFSRSFETVSPDCGFVTKYENITLDNTSFEKAEINFDYTIDNDSTNVRVFL